MITEDQLEQLAIQWFQDTGKLASRNPSPRPSPTGRGRKAAEREDRGNIEHRTLNIERRSEEKRRWAARRRNAMPGQVLHVVTKPEHSMGRPFRAWNPVGGGTQGGALGCRMVPRWGGRRWATCKDRLQVRFGKEFLP
jgi:hypothetical protein